MKELIVRALSGLLYVSIIIMAMYAAPQWFIGLVLVLGLITIYEFQKLVNLKQLLPYLLLIVLMYITAYDPIHPKWIMLYAILCIAVNLYLLKEVLNPKAQLDALWIKYVVLCFYLIGGFVMLALIPFSVGGQFDPRPIIGVFILIWANDSFAYLIGKSMGRHKLLERISPKKTIEGFVGGLVGSMLASIVIFNYTELYSLSIWLLLAVMISVLGTFGDLIQSKFKRNAGVKDSGTIMPGHGGIYDRLDSIIYTSPFIYLFLELAEHVS